MSCATSSKTVLDRDGSVSVALDMKEPVSVVTSRVAPDGGYGWLVSVSTFVITFLITGFLKSSSVWGAAIRSEYPAITTVEATWIPGCIATLSLFCSPATSALLQQFGHGLVAAAGSGAIALGFLISSFATSGGYLIGSLGVCIGIGSSFLITASVGCTGKFFTTRKPIAMTIALSGGCVGAIAMPYALRHLLGALGLSHAFLVLSGTFLVLSLSGMIYANPESHFNVEEKEVPEGQQTVEVEPAQKKTFWRSAAELMALSYISRPLFLLMAFSVFAMGMGSPHFLGQISGQAKRLGANADSISLLTLLSQLADLFARLVYGMLAPKSPFKRTSEYTSALAICASCAVVGIFCNAFWQLAVLTFLGSFAAGVMNISIPLVLSANHGAKNMGNTLNLVRWFQGASGIVYRFVSPEVPSYADVPGLLILNCSNLWFAAILGFVMCLIPKNGN